MAEAVGGDRLRLWLLYAAVAVAVGVAGGLVGAALLEGPALRALRVAAALACGIQLLAFAALVALRDAPGSLFLIGWGGGILLRFMAVGVLAFWLQRTAALPLAATLVSFVFFLFVLLLLEPVFLRRGSRRKQ
ncbi:MAG: hypothetical protein WEA24_15185 [Gemmatimonadota bacterium]